MRHFPVWFLQGKRSSSSQYPSHYAVHLRFAPRPENWCDVPGVSRSADQLSVSLESITLKEAGVSVLNNVDVKNEIEADAIRNALVRQLYSPVRWTETVEKMAQNGVEVLVEVGPGKVLNGLTKRIVDSLQAVSVNDVKSLDSVEEVLA